MLIIRRHVTALITRRTRQVTDWLLRVRFDLGVEILGANGYNGPSVSLENSTGGAKVGEKLGDWDMFVFQNTGWRNEVVLEVDDEQRWRHVFLNATYFDEFGR